MIIRSLTSDGLVDLGPGHVGKSNFIGWKGVGGLLFNFGITHTFSYQKLI